MGRSTFELDNRISRDIPIQSCMQSKTSFWIYSLFWFLSILLWHTRFSQFFLFLTVSFSQEISLMYILLTSHSVPEWIWIKGSYLSQWPPQGERGPPKESKSQWIEILHGGSQFTLWFLKIKNFRITPKFFFALQYIKNWTKVVPWKKIFCSWKKNS